MSYPQSLHTARPTAVSYVCRFYEIPYPVFDFDCNIFVALLHPAMLNMVRPEKGTLSVQHKLPENSI